MKFSVYDTRLSRRCRGGERGASRLSLIFLLALLALAVYVGYLFVPVAYQASLYKVYMQDTVDKAVATGKPAAWVEEQLKSGGGDYDVPDDAVFKVENRDGYLEANARFTHFISLPGYTYEYDFDHTVRSSSPKQN
ncbi:MAG TPA: hypothetical protein VGB73_07195 [Pyrinomonadaceae bacterium]|jgi:hypothetical protein